MSSVSQPPAVRVPGCGASHCAKRCGEGWEARGRAGGTLEEREAYRALGCHGKAGKARGWAPPRRDVLREGWREDGGGMLVGAPQMSSAQGRGGFGGATCGKACRSAHGEDGPAL